MCDVTLRPGSPGIDTGPSRWTLFTLSWPPPHVPEMGRWLRGGGGGGPPGDYNGFLDDLFMQSVSLHCLIQL